MVKIKNDKNNTRSDPTNKRFKYNARAICKFCKNRMNKHCKICFLCPGYHAPDCENKWK